MEAAEEKVLTTQDSISNTYSYDGYEILHDEAMDKISVSIHYSDYEEAFEGKSQNNLVKPKESEEKKMKISLSQDQLKLNPSVCNFLSVPKTTRKSQSSSFFFSEKPNENDLMKSLLKPEAFESSTVRRNPILNHNKIFLPPSTFPKVDVDNDEIVYATPRRSQVIVENEIKVSSASSAPTVVQTCSTADFSENSIFPSSFYCKICNNVLSDPRTLDCLHTFCMQCLARLDASNDLQNNQFWRKISEEHSDASCELATFDFLLFFDEISCFSVHQFNLRPYPASIRILLKKANSHSPEASKAKNFPRTKQVFNVRFKNIDFTSELFFLSFL